MLPTQHVILALTPDALEGALLNGRKVARAAAMPLDRGAWRQAWADGLIPYDETLVALLRELRVREGARAVVYAQSPTSIVDVCTLNAQGPAAVQAGVLRVTERIHSTSARPAADAAVVATDSSGGDRRSHVLAAADDNLAAQAILGWVARAGCKFEGYVPRAVIPLNEVLLRAADDDSPCVAWCYLDKATTALAAMDKGELMFVRSIEVGYQAMVEAYARGMVYEDEASLSPTPPSPDMARAAVLLFEQGVPARDAKIGQRGSAHRRVVGPLLAPVVQRLSVEIKQTLRYGVGDPDRRPRRLVLIGPGAAIPGMATLLTESTELDVEAARPDASRPPTTPFAIGTAEHSLAVARAPDLTLLPTAAAERLAASRRTAALRAGALVAAALLLGEAGLITLDRRALAQRLDDHRPELDAIREELARREAVAAEAARLDLASYLSAGAIGEQPAWGSAFLEIAAVCAGSVRLSEVRAFADGGESIVAIAGEARDEASAPPGSSLGAFIDALKASPLVKRVELGSASNLGDDAGSGKKFSVRCALHEFPITHAHPGLYVGPRPAVLEKKKRGSR